MLNLLKQEVELLRSLVISTIGKDGEGEYKPEFVKKVIKASKEKTSYEFKGETYFLKHLASADD